MSTEAGSTRAGSTPAGSTRAGSTPAGSTPAGSTAAGKGPAAPDPKETRQRTAAEIEADLVAKRLELTQSVDELVNRIDPRTQVTGFVEDVKAGEPRAVSIVGGVAAAIAGIVGLGLLRRNR